MSEVDAIYTHGVFQPLHPVHLSEQERVRLRIKRLNGESPLAWLTRVRGLQADVAKREGNLPDSTTDIAADRMR